MKDSPGFYIEECSRSQLTGLLSFAKRMREKKELLFTSQRNHFLSKYRKADDDNSLSILLLKNKQQMIVGCGGYVPFSGMFRGKNVKGVIGTDIVVDPGQRDSFPSLFAALFLHFRSFVTENQYFFLNFPTDSAVSANFKRFWWEDFSGFQELIAPLSLYRRSLPKATGIELQKAQDFGPDFDSFFRRISCDHHFLMHADSAFLNWKYFDDPYRDFQVIAARKQKTVIGYVVAESIGSDVDIVDIVIDLRYPRLIPLLLAEAVSQFPGAAGGKVYCSVGHSRYVNILRRAGFVCRRRRDCLYFTICTLFSAVNKRRIALSDSSTYHLNGAARYAH